MIYEIRCGIYSILLGSSVAASRFEELKREFTQAELPNLHETYGDIEPMMPRLNKRKANSPAIA